MNINRYITKIQDLLADKQNKKRAFLYMLIIILLIMIIPLILFERTLKASADANSAKLRHLIVYGNEYKSLKEKLSTIESKNSNLPVGGITNLANDLTASIGIREKMKSIKGVSSHQPKGNISEETAEISFEKLTTNELINLLHKIETMPAALSVKKAYIKKSFERPDLLDVNISLVLFNIQQEAKP